MCCECAVKVLLALGGGSKLALEQTERLQQPRLLLSPFGVVVARGGTGQGDRRGWPTRGLNLISTKQPTLNQAVHHRTASITPGKKAGGESRSLIGSSRACPRGTNFPFSRGASSSCLAAIWLPPCPRWPGGSGLGCTQDEES